MSKLDQLPSELISLILNYVSNKDLPSCALINKFFYREAMSLLWHTIDIYSRKEYTAFTTCLIQSPNAPGHHVRSLYFANCWDLFTDASLLGIIQYVPKLESLGTCMGHIIGDASLQHVPHYCPHLTSLDIRCDTSPDQDNYRITHATLSAFGLYCKLSKLDLSECAYLDYNRLWGALEKAPLTTVRLTLPRQVDTQVALQFVETAPLALHRYQQLTTLSIGSIREDNTGFITTINTHGLTWPHLTSFNLWRCDSLTDAMALTFVQAHPTIENLSLDLSNLTDAFLDGLDLPNLTMLSVEGNPAITGPGICRLITNYGGGLKDGVYCDDCDIYPEDLPDDKTYGYRLLFEDIVDPPIEWFNGTFYDNSDSEQDTQDDDDPS